MSYKQATTTTRSRQGELAFPCGHLPAIFIATSTPRLASRPHTRLGRHVYTRRSMTTHPGVGGSYAANCRGPPVPQPFTSTPYTAVCFRHIFSTLPLSALPSPPPGHPNIGHLIWWPAAPPTPLN